MPTVPPLATRLVPLALLAAAGTIIAGWTAWRTVAPQLVPPLSEFPQQGPWTQRISASGLIEGDGDDILIGVPEAGLVSEVGVRSGQDVVAGGLLIRLDDRLIRADLAVAEAELALNRTALIASEAELAVATAKAGRVSALPRAEDAVPYAARVGVAEARLADARIHRMRGEELFNRHAIAAEKVDLLRGAENIAKAEVASAQAELATARNPAWEPDRAIANSEVVLATARVATAKGQLTAAEARCAAIRTRIERLSIRAPCAATVVAVSVTVGSFAAPTDQRLVVLANLKRLLVRVEVDESQAWKLLPVSPGSGWIRGDSQHTIALVFERMEPQAGARRSIAGKPGERLDGRALQVLYQLIDPPPFVHPGFMLEVDLQAGDAASAATNQAGSSHG